MSWGNGSELGKSKESMIKKTVSFNGTVYGRDKRLSIQKEQPEFQIQTLEDSIQPSFESKVNGANDENNQGFEYSNNSEVSVINLSSQELELGNISKAVHIN